MADAEAEAVEPEGAAVEGESPAGESAVVERTEGEATQTVGAAESGTAGAATRVRIPLRRGLGLRLAEIERSPHTSTQALRWSLILTVLLGVAYWFTQWPLLRLTRSNPNLNFYLAQPLIWLTIAGLAFYGWLRLKERPPFSRLLMGIALLVGVFHVAVTVIAGVIWGFGSSPIAGKLINYPKNFLFIATLLAGAEVSRAYLYWVWRRWNQQLAFFGTAALFFAISVAAAQWAPFGSVDQGLRVVGGRWLPAIALSLLCTWLVAYGGMGPSFGYRFALVAFEWFSPILPNLEWPIVLSVGIGVPLVSSWLVSTIYGDTKEGQARMAAEPVVEEAAKEKREPRPAWVRWAGWGVTAAIIAVLVLFVVGVFGYHLSVVDGASMDPTYSRGDLLFVREGVEPESLRVGDVIQFHEGSIPVVHRVTAIAEGEGGLVFTTQGDNMPTADPPITADQIDGKVVFSLPGVGYLSLWVRGR